LRARLKALAALGPEQARLAAAPLFQTENSLKIFQGRAAALRDSVTAEWSARGAGD